jgi:type II secretory pathway component PulJ
MTRRPEAGITLMELLVAMALLSLLSVSMLFAIRIGLSAMEKSQDRLQTNRRVMGVEKVFSAQLAGLIPAKADCQSLSGNATTLPFFQGEPTTMRFVSSYSLQEAGRGYPRILEFQVATGEQGIGVRLIVNEILYTGPKSTGALCAGTHSDPLADGVMLSFRPVAIGNFSFVLADKLAYCRFFYKEEKGNQAELTEKWMPTWHKQRVPSAIHVEMGPLSPDPSKLQLLDFTAPVRVNRDPLMKYGD